MSDAVKLLWGSGDLTIINPTRQMEEELIYEHRSLERDEAEPWKEAGMRFDKVDLFTVVAENPRTIVTYQGLVDLVIDICNENRIPFEFADVRLPFPKPNLKQVKGFRFSQFRMFLELLKYERSGIFKAPTRYGKTTIIANTLRAFPFVKSVLAAPGIDLLNQTVADLQAKLPGREVKGIYTGVKAAFRGESEDITVCSMDSLEKIANPDDVKLLLVDEPHAAATPTRIPLVSRFKQARIYSYGATTDGRFDKADKVITGLFGPVLALKTFPEAVKEGAICQIVVYVVKVPFQPWKVLRRDAAYKALLHKNVVFNQTVKHLSDHIIPADWQTLIFIDNTKQGDLLNLFVKEGVMAVAQRMTGNQRNEMFKNVRSGEIKRCICTNIYATGVTIPDIRCIINAAGGGGSITATQKPGRLAEIRPGKKAGYLVDFLFEPLKPQRKVVGFEEKDRADSWKSVVNECWTRIDTYRNNGYDVRIVNDPSQIIFE